MRTAVSHPLDLNTPNLFGEIGEIKVSFTPYGHLTRRGFIKVAGASAAVLMSNGEMASASEPSRGFEHGSPLKEFSYGQVDFQPGLHQTQLKQTHSVLMSLSEDSLLRPYRKRAGLAAPGCDLGGWYNEREPAPFGQWISALSRYCAIANDGESRAKVDRLVREFALTVEPTGKLYEHGASAYLYDKLVCGLMDAHQFAQQPLALDVLARATAAARVRLPGKAIDQFEENAHESYTVPENQFIAWQRGGDPSHLAIAKAYLHDRLFDPLSRGENILAGRHAYSHVNALCSAAKAYLVLGDNKYLLAAKNGFSFVEAQSFATGGWGPNEAFLPARGPFGGNAINDWMPPINTLYESLARTHYHFETCCGAYAHFKLTRYLLRITKNSSYGDSMERVMYNTVLGAKVLQENGMSFYYSDYNPDGRKISFGGYGYGDAPQWPCCSGTLPQVAADYRISTYFADAEGVYVSLFIPSTVKWQQGGAQVALTQSGSYPLDDVVSMVIQTSRPRTFTLRLRIPMWARQPSIRINGKRITTSVLPGTFTSLKREWRSDDRIDLELPRSIELTPIDADHPDTVAVMYGPLVLFAVSTTTRKVTRQQLLAAARPSPEKSEWRVDTPEGPLRLMPFWVIDNERYTTYLSL